MKFVLILCFCACLLAALVESCEILMKAESITATPFLLVLTKGDTQIKQLQFDGPGKQNFMITGDNCADQQYMFSTFQQEPPGSGNWALAKQMEAKLDGNGEMGLTVGDTLQPWGGGRFGVACSESFFCG